MKRLGTFFWILVAVALARGLWHYAAGDDAASTDSATRRGTRDVPTLVVVTFDALRTDRLAAFGAPFAVMPQLDALAARAVVFTDQTTASSGTNAALAALFTGRFPETHGVTSLHRTGRTALPQSETTLAELLAAEGWRTLAFCGLGSLAPEISALDQGFAHYDAPSGAERFATRRASEVLELARVPLTEALASGDPVFVWFHFADAHATLKTTARRPGPDRAAAAALLRHRLAAVPGSSGRGGVLTSALDALDGDFDEAYAALDKSLTAMRAVPAAVAFHAAKYDFAVQAMDAQVGALVELVERSGRLGSTTFVATATRGEDLSVEPTDEEMLRELARVPCLVRLPGALAARVSAGTRSVDLLPTLYAALDLGEPEAVDGESLVGALEGQPVATRTGRFWKNGTPPELTILRDGEVQRLERLFTSTPSEAVSLPEERFLAERGGASATVGADFAGVAQWSLWTQAPLSTTRRDGVYHSLEALFGRPAVRITVAVEKGSAPFELEGRGFLGPPCWVARSPRAAWPANAEGVEAGFDVDVRHAAGRWLVVELGSQTPGVAGEMLVCGLSHERVELEVRSTDATLTPVPGHPHLVRASGNTPLLIEVEKLPSAEFGVAARLAGEPVARDRMRYLGDQFSLAGHAELYVPDWCPGWVEEGGASERTLLPGERPAGDGLVFETWGVVAPAEVWSSLSPLAQAYVDRLEENE